MEEKKKQDKSFNIVFGIFMVAVVILGALYIKSVVKPEVTINGKTLKPGMTVQELVGQGFTLSTSSAGEGSVNIATEKQIPGEKYSTTPYYMFVNGEDTNVNFRVYNKDVNSCAFKDSKIYSFTYHAGVKFNKAKVLVNGIDFCGMDKEAAVAAFEELGVKFDKDDKEEFLSGEIGILIGKSGDFSFTLEDDYEKKVIEFVEVKLKV